MRVAIRILAGLVLLALAALVLAPASVVDSVLAARTGGRARLVDARGLWWRGYGTLATANGDARMPIAWRVGLLPLAERTLDVEFVARDAAMPRGHLRVAPDALDARDLRLSVPAALLPAFAPVLEPVVPSGHLDVSAAAFAWRPRRADGNVDAVWRDARLAILGIPVALGRIVSTISGTSGGAQGAFDNTGGEVAIHGTWRAVGDRLETASTLTPNASTPPALRALLPMLGPPDAQGAVHVAWQGKR